MIALFFICECIIAKKELGGVSVVEYQRPWWDMRLCTKSIVIMIIINAARIHYLLICNNTHFNEKTKKTKKFQE